MRTETCKNKTTLASNHGQDDQSQARPSEPALYPTFYKQQLQRLSGVVATVTDRTPKASDPLNSFWSNQRRTYGAAGDQGSLEDGGPSGPPGRNNNNNNNNGNGTNKISVGNIIGDFGLFQFIVLLFSGLREACVGYDALVTSVVTQPENRFICRDGLSASRLLEVSSLYSKQLSSASSELNKSTTSTNPDWSQCFRQDATGQSRTCSSWLFLPDQADPMRPSLVTEWELVCDRSWWIAFAESAYFFGLVLGNLIWGYYADRLGRRKAYLIAHSLALVAGWAAVFMPNVALFALCRFFAALGSIGYNVIYSIQVELIGAKHRSLSTVMNHLGWGLGVMCVPFVCYVTSSAKIMLAVGPILTLMMFPWAFWIPESPRWLMVNGRFELAKRQLLRAAKFNGQPCDEKREEMIKWLKEQIIDDKLEFDTKNAANLSAKAGSPPPPPLPLPLQQQHQQPPALPASSKSTYRLLFENHRRDTLILSFASFAGHLFYYLLTINFGYTKNLSTEANFISSGLGEWVCVVLGAVLIRLLTRKNIMSLCLFLMACSFAFQSLIDSNLVPELNSVTLVTANNAIGTLSGLLLVFVVLIVNQEVYPTVIRQTGASIANTLGESGSTLAPWLIYLNRLIGLWRADLICMCTCLFGIVSVQFLTKTDNVELTDV